MPSGRDHRSTDRAVRGNDGSVKCVAEFDFHDGGVF
jgi:hypothetical protein